VWGALPNASNSSRDLPASSSSSSAPRSGGHSTAASSHAALAAVSGRAGSADQDGDYERSQVLELCAHGGTRAVPPKDKLDAFVEAARTLDPELVGPILLEQIFEDGPWQVKSKALVVIDALVKSEGCEAYQVTPLAASRPISHFSPDIRAIDCT
jgi:hypothetical protein